MKIRTETKYKIRRLIAKIMSISLLAFVYDAIFIYGIIK